MDNAQQLRQLIGYRIKFFRERRGMKQLDLAGAIGITSGGMSQIESGDNLPTTENLKKISDVLEVPISILMSGAEIDDETLVMLVDIFKIASRQEKSKHLEAIKALIKLDLKNIE